ncbi:UDP-4-amino-4,6-dideoxy-N-acetyl-beta-L-altrosamine transaminase [Emticicia aquatilis]|nr:UDP-4-amino-4,6-dideoxy-N-acetyl-beta-L-altrosamine transaminase [Emticicia aquatilis]
MTPIPYGRQCITEDDIDVVVKSLQSNFLTQGPTIEAFENVFADYIGCKYAVAVSNGTAALHLSALALGVNKNSKVITSPITFAASANCVLYCGGEVIFADIEEKSAVLDINKVRELLVNSPKGTFQGIIPIDFAGFPVNMESFRQLADEFDCWLLEDSCHSPGGFFMDSNGVQQNCGNGQYADLAIFSFHPVKHIACGEGGMITTNNKELYEKLLRLRTHGITKDSNKFVKKTQKDGAWYYEMQELGYNYRLPDLNAALGISQLQRAHEGIERRIEIARKYDAAFENTQIKTLHNPRGHAYHLYVIQVDNRLGLYNYLKDNEIYAQVHYIPVHTLPYYQGLGWKNGDFPIAEAYYEKCLSLPMYPSLTDKQQDFVINSIKNYYNGN